MASKGAAQFPAINSPQRAGRSKVALKPGRSLMDWIRLTHTETNLSGLNGKVLDVTAEELSRHNKKDDAWICLKGKVYNITPYMEYHPGGEEELMRGAGRDATDLFNQIHKWVNAESMLQKCFVGKMKMSSLWLQRATSLSGRLPPVANLQQKVQDNVNNKGNAEVLNSKLPSMSEKQVPKYDWFQSESSVSLVIYTKWKDIRKEHIIIDLKGKCLQVSARIKEYSYQLHLELEKVVSSSYEVKVGSSSGAVEILFVKEGSAVSWQNLGHPLTGHNSFTKTKDAEVCYRPCQLTSKIKVTHDTFLLSFSLPLGTTMLVPLGHHVHLRRQVDGMEIVRSYTPVLASLDVPQETPNESDGEGHILHLMIKIYSKGVLTPVLNKIEVGDTMDISDYQGDFDGSHIEEYSTLVLLAAGTGFTPMVRLIYWALAAKQNRTIKLLFFNKTEEDILWREYLNQLSKGDCRLQVKHVLSEPSENWTGSKGRISKQLLESFVPPETVESKLFICVCGPTQFSKTALEYLEDLGYNREKIHAFLG